MIRVLEHSASSPAENLALDEALLDACEAGEVPEVLRFWEPLTVFVVVGYANAIQQEVRTEECQQAGVPILRRCSGGGTVLQMPGILNYTLVLKTSEIGPLSTLVGTNRFIMERLRAACGRLPGIKGPLTIRGVTDLCFDDQKFMGNAQRRKRRALVFHGSLLLNADLAAMERYLKFPSKSPEYRFHRSHLDFCSNLVVPVREVKRAFQEEWNAAEPLGVMPEERVRNLMETRYERSDWNSKL